jgi:F-type H+-transporting ATPase subunit a
MYNYSWFWLLPGVQEGEPLKAIHEALPAWMVVDAEVTAFHAVPAAWGVVLICAVFGLMARAGINSARAKGGIEQYVPDAGLGPRNLMELLLGAILNFASDTLNNRDLATRYFPVFASVFIYVLVSNLMGLIPGFLPPTGSVSTNFAIALVVFVVFNFAGLKEAGFGYVKHMAGPVWWLAFFIFPVELFSMLIRPMTLAVRLYINMFADHLLLGVSTEMIAYVLPAAFVGLGTFVSFVQAFVFMLLTVVYVTLSVGDGDHH